VPWPSPIKQSRSFAIGKAITKNNAIRNITSLMKKKKYTIAVNQMMDGSKYQSIKNQSFTVTASGL